ncbi:MAG: response regulator [Bacteroidetes bacterium]|nr:response regulator [Bacteroidota bacterium]MBM3424117.1 response regulator [Bacteroidota bacterium]
MEELKYAVVCVDDDPFILQMLGFQLSKIVDQKCTLLEYFTDPHSALSSIDNLVEEKIDIIFIIVDYQMPQMSGGQLVRAIKSKYPELKCVMLSGHANEVSVGDLIQEKLLDAFISKPWDEGTLFEAICPILDKIR